MASLLTTKTESTQNNGVPSRSRLQVYGVHNTDLHQDARAGHCYSAGDVT